MTVTDNRSKTVIFDSLCKGDTFICDRSVYLALPKVKYCDITYNAYNLNDEYFAFFDDDASVEPIEVELVIK
jgi:hypothetical protein